MGVRTASTIQGWQQDLGMTISDAIQRLLGLGPVEETAAGITKQWTKEFATPVMDMWNRAIAPLVSESYNLPGSFYSRATGRGVAKEASNFFSGSVQPTLFSALENMRARNIDWARIFSSTLGQGAGLSTAQTLQSWYKPAMSSTERFESVSRSLNDLLSIFADGGGGGSGAGAALAL